MQNINVFKTTKYFTFSLEAYVILKYNIQSDQPIRFSTRI